jgi:hypothetical protein
MSQRYITEKDNEAFEWMLKQLNEQRQYGPEITRQHILDLLKEIPTPVYSDEEIVMEALEEEYSK